MKTPMTIHPIPALLLMLCLFVGANSATAQGYDAIDTVELTPVADGTRVAIRFNLTLQYLGHTPRDQGRRLFVDLRLVQQGADDSPLPEEQQLKFQPTPQAPLSRINYRSSGEGTARMELELSSRARFELKPDSDFRGITITLLPVVGDDSREPQRATPTIERQASALMREARKSLVDERNFPRAAGLYQQVMDLPENSQSQAALEYLGLSYERMGEREQALKVYQGYLARYDTGDGSERVRQRMMSLATATQQAQKKRQQSKQDGEGWKNYGALSQLYLHNGSSVDGSGSETTNSSIVTTLSLDSQRHGKRSDTRLRLAASQQYDLLNSESGDLRLSSLYLLHRDRESDWWLQAGRQRSSRDGVLSRFDGLKLGYRLGKRVELSATVGHPVMSTAEMLDTGRLFTGLALDLGPFAKHWELSLYAIEQRVDTLVDRQGVGGELRYFKPSLTVLGMVDYDTFYSELNIGMVLANWTLSNNTTLNASLDVRKLPFLTTSNALVGQLTADNQAVEDIAQLRTLYSDQEIYQLARDRTAQARTVTLGLSHPLNNSLRIAADVSLMRTGATSASGGVAATAASGDNVSLNLQMIGTGILNGDDLTTLGIRGSSSDTVDSVGLYGGSRLPLRKPWRIYPRLKLDQRQWNSVDQSELIFSPSIQIDYRLNNMRFWAELGTEWVDRSLTSGSEQTLSTSAILGYHFTF